MPHFGFTYSPAAFYLFLIDNTHPRTCLCVGGWHDRCKHQIVTIIADIKNQKLFTIYKINASDLEPFINNGNGVLGADTFGWLTLHYWCRPCSAQGMIWCYWMCI